MVFQNRLKTWYLLSSVILGLPFASLGQQTPQPLHTIRASADAVVSARPDRAQVSAAVYSQASSPEAASQQNAQITSRVLDALKAVMGPKGQVNTSGFFASPQMQYGGGTPKITGYEATNHLTVTVDDLSLVSKVVDTAVNAGANQIQGISFSLKNDESVRAQALAQASRKAYEAAQTIAKALNLTVAGVLEAQTGTEPTTPIPMLRTSQSVGVGGTAAATPTPIEPGAIDIRATVTVTLEVR